MKIDETLLEIFDTTREIVKERYNIELSNEQLLNILNAQIEGFKYGVLKGFTVFFTGFGKFVNVKRKEVAIEGTKFVSNLEVLKQIYPDLDEVALRKEYIIQKAKEKEAILKGTLNPNSLTAEQVINSPDVSAYNKVQFRPMHRTRTNESN